MMGATIDSAEFWPRDIGHLDGLGGFATPLPLPPRACVDAMARHAGNASAAYAAALPAFDDWHSDALRCCGQFGTVAVSGPVMVLILVPRGIELGALGGLTGCALTFIERERLIDGIDSVIDVCVRYADNGMLAVAVWQVEPGELDENELDQADLDQADQTGVD